MQIWRVMIPHQHSFLGRSVWLLLYWAWSIIGCLVIWLLQGIVHFYLTALTKESCPELVYLIGLEHDRTPWDRPSSMILGQAQLRNFVEIFLVNTYFFLRNKYVFLGYKITKEIKIIN